MKCKSKYSMISFLENKQINMYIHVFALKTYWKEGNENGITAITSVFQRL